MSRPTPTADSQNAPIPRRFCWLKRLQVAGLIWLVVLCTLRWLWALEADRGLAAIVTDAKARGEPVLQDDFRQPPVPDAQNAADLLIEAAQSLSSTTNLYRLNPVDEFDPIPAAHMTVIANAMSANAKPLALARQASTRPAVSWPAPSTQPSSRRWRFDQRSLSSLLFWAAIYQHESHSDAEALSTARDMLRQADALGGQPAEFIDRLLSIVIESEAVEVVNRVSRPSGAGTPMQPEVRQRSRETISFLLRDDHYHEADVKAAYAMRKDALQVESRIGEYLSDVPLDRLVLRPMYVLDVARTASKSAEIARASKAVTAPAASARVPRGEPFEPDLFRKSRPFGVPWNGRYWDFYKAAVRRRSAAVKLAIRLYRDDHDGRLPPRLDDLVPQYLPSVPLDAMAAGARPLGYRPDAKTPLIYSVGSDGKDDGGVESTRGGSDDVFYLEAPPPKPPRPRRAPTSRPPTSRQAEQHQGNQNDARNQPPAQRP